MVSLSQKGNDVSVTVTVDCGEILVEHTKNQADIQSARTMSLSRKELTDAQKDVENKKYDAEIAASLRAAHLKMFDLAMAEVRAAQEHASLSDEDRAKQAADAKAKIDEEHAKKEANRPEIVSELAGAVN